MAKAVIDSVFEANPPLVPGESDLQFAGMIPDELHRAHPNVQLLIETAPNSNEYEPEEGWDWTSIETGRDGRETRATLVIRSLDAQRYLEAHFVDYLLIFDSSRRVRIQIDRGASPPIILFSGYPQTATPQWQAESQSMQVTCVAEPHERLRVGERAHVMGRVMRQSDNTPVTPAEVFNEVTALPTVFNPGGKGNRLPGEGDFPNKGFVLDWPDTDLNPPSPPLPADARRIHLFADDGDKKAKKWTYIQALRHVVWMYVVLRGAPISVAEFLDDTTYLHDQTPQQNDDPFDTLLTQHVEDVSVTSLNAEEAIAALCEKAGVHYQIALRVKPEGDVYQPQFFLRVWADIRTDAERMATVTRRMYEPVVRDLPRAAPFTHTSGQDIVSVASQSRIHKASITFDRRAINHVKALGGYREFECTLLLRPGWAPHAMLDNLLTAEARDAAKAFWEEEFRPEKDEQTGKPRSIYHTGHPSHHTVADVFRKWVFPDTNEYLTFGRENWPSALYQTQDPDGPLVELTPTVYVRGDIGGDIQEDEVRDWVVRPRPFRDTIGRRSKYSEQREPIVRFNFTATSPYTALASANWIEWGGQAFFDPNKAALSIREANLWDNLSVIIAPDAGDADDNRAIEAFIDGKFFVSVTCVVVSDQRMSAEHDMSGTGASYRKRTAVVDFGYTKYRYRSRRGQNSHLNVLPVDELEYENRDDQETLNNRARSINLRSHLETVAGDPEMWWIEPSYRVGDAFVGVSGLGIVFYRYPAIELIEYSKGDQGYRTTLHLTDLRHDASVGRET